jgi:hypothetical protein
MLDPLIFIDLFTETYALLQRHTAGVSQAMSLHCPSGMTTCANWLVGHIVATRANVLLGLLDVPDGWDLAALMRFIPESAVIVDETGAGHTSQLLSDLARSQNQLLAILTTITPEALQSVVGEQTIGAQLLLYHAHEAYHAGQLDIVCQLARAGG